MPTPGGFVRGTGSKSKRALWNTVLLVDRHGDLAWPVDIARWAEQVQGPEPLPAPCPRPYLAHARATISGGHVALILSPAQEIKVLAHGQLTFAFTDGRWRLLDIAAKYDAWREAVGPTRPADLADRIFRAALNLSEQRHGALFVILRNPAESLPMLLAPEDRAVAQRQGICPVTRKPLGSMGTQPRLMVAGRVVFLCCDGCEDALRRDPAKYLARLPAAPRP